MGSSGGVFRPYRVESPDGGARDPFNTAALRRRVLDAWADSASRFREDANAEEDLALGGYRDRLIVELAQNAADAAQRADRPGRLRLTLREGTLAAANTGEPLDAAGAESLSTLRASAKRDSDEAASGGSGGPPVGRFGVGFAAVLAVSDEPAVLGRRGGVRWSLAEARELARETAERSAPLAQELVRRDGHVPLLRLPMAAEGTSVPADYDTVVMLPLRDGAAVDLAARLLAEIDDSLLLALPALAEIMVETPDGTRLLTQRREGTTAVIAESGPDGASVERRWQTAEASGRLPAELLADRPVEERTRPYWAITWAVPVDAENVPLPPKTVPVVHAPTPTDEPLELPALLIGTFPLDPTRRHIAPGPLTDHLLAHAADTYTRLLRERPPSPSNLNLVPAPLGPGGTVDAPLRAAILTRLPKLPFLPPSSPSDPHNELGGVPERAGHASSQSELGGVPGHGRQDGEANSAAPEPDLDTNSGIRPDRAVLLESATAALITALTDVISDLLPAGMERNPALRTLHVRRLPLAELVDSLAGLDRTPTWWHTLYSALSGTNPEALGSLPVPLADGRTVTGPRRVFLWDPSLTSDAEDSDPTNPEDPTAAVSGLSVLGLRIAHPDASHPLLERLGAAPATASAILESERVRSAVAGSLDADPEEAAALAGAVLRLVRAAKPVPGAHPWLADLALTDDYGDPAPAGELVLPGSPLAELLDPEEAGQVDAALLERWGPAALTALGVMDRPVILGASDVVLDPDDPDGLELPVHTPSAATDPGPAVPPDGIEDWCEDVLDRVLPPEDDDEDEGDAPREVPPVAAELLAVRDLDMILPEAWPQALALLAEPPLREAVTRQVRVLLPDGRAVDAPPYTAWWLSRHPVLDGVRPADLRAPGTDPLLDGLYPEAATELDQVFLHALGVRTSLDALLAEPGGPAELLDRLADPERQVTPDRLRAIHDRLAEVDPGRVPHPDRVRVLRPDGTGTVVVDAAEAIVADSPDLLPLLAGRPLLPVAPDLAADLADLLGVATADEVAGGRVLSEGTVRAVPEAIRVLLPGVPAEYEEHEELILIGPDGTEVELDWRWERSGDGSAGGGGGTLHAATVDGLARGLAWAADAWARRFELAAMLAEPEQGEALAAERLFEF